MANGAEGSTGNMGSGAKSRARPRRHALRSCHLAAAACLATAAWCLLPGALLIGQEYLPDLPADHPAVRYGPAPAYDEVGRLADELA
ncbi:MAG: hypothetical protein OEW19_14640, partial [Acidobacteriota bacterium]|nr:hypothetical protein [Acidobacteriota bacterium]